MFFYYKSSSSIKIKRKKKVIEHLSRKPETCSILSYIRQKNSNGSVVCETVETATGLVQFCGPCYGLVMYLLVGKGTPNTETIMVSIDINYSAT